MLYCKFCQEKYDLKERAFIIFSTSCDLCHLPIVDCYFSTDVTDDLQKIMEDNEDT